MRAMIHATAMRLAFLAVVAVLAPVAALAGFGAVRLLRDVSQGQVPFARDGAQPGDVAQDQSDDSPATDAQDGSPSSDQIVRRARDAWAGFADAVEQAARDGADSGDAAAALAGAEPTSPAAVAAAEPLPASTLDVRSIHNPGPTKVAAEAGREPMGPDPRNAAFDDWVSRARAFEAPRPHRVRYAWSWEDHSSRIIRFEGDRAVIDRKKAPTSYEIEVPIDVALAEDLELHFGFPRQALAFWYRSPEELLERLDAQQYALEACGMRFVPDDVTASTLSMPKSKSGTREQVEVEGSDRRTGSIGPDYQQLLDHSREGLRPIAEAILKKAKAAGAKDRRSQLAALASFVQHLPYEIPAKLPDGKERAGLRTPMATLIWGGDCDSKSLLLAGLVRSVNLCDATLVHVDRVPGGAPRPSGSQADDSVGHMIAGFDVTARPEDFTIDQGRQRYVLVETTSDWRIGRISARVAQSVISRTDGLR